MTKSKRNKRNKEIENYQRVQLNKLKCSKYTGSIVKGFNETLKAIEKRKEQLYSRRERLKEIAIVLEDDDILKFDDQQFYDFIQQQKNDILERKQKDIEAREQALKDEEERVARQAREEEIRKEA